MDTRMAVLLILSFLAQNHAMAKAMNATEGTLCLHCQNTPDQRTQQEDRLGPIKQVVEKTLGAPPVQLSVVIGNPQITNLNRNPIAPNKFDFSTGICKISTDSLDGNAWFAGGALHFLASNMHLLSSQGPVHDQEVMLKCGARGSPPTFSFSKKVKVKVEAQGQFNLEGRLEKRREDFVLLSVVDADKVFKDFKHFSFVLTDGNLTIEDFKDLLAHNNKYHSILRVAAFSRRQTIVTSNGSNLEFYPEEMYMSGSCHVFSDLGGLWDNDCPVIHGASGSVTILDRGTLSPILVGLNARGPEAVKSEKTPDYEDSAEIYYQRNAFIPVYQMQAIIQRNQDLWHRLIEAEESESAQVYQEFGSPLETTEQQPAITDKNLPKPSSSESARRDF